MFLMVEIPDIQTETRNSKKAVQTVSHNYICFSLLHEVFLTVKWKVASLFYVGLSICLLMIYPTYYFTLKSINWLDEIWKIKNYGENYIVSHTSPMLIKIKKKINIKLNPMGLILILKDFFSHPQYWTRVLLF
jgi:hypothetical protein